MNGGLAAAPPLISVRRSLGDRLGLASGGSRPAPPAPVSRNPEAGGAATKPFPAPESETGLSYNLVKRSSCGAMTHQTGIHGRKKNGEPGKGGGLLSHLLCRPGALPSEAGCERPAQAAAAHSCPSPRFALTTGLPSRAKPPFFCPPAPFPYPRVGEKGALTRNLGLGSFRRLFLPVESPSVFPACCFDPSACAVEVGGFRSRRASLQ